MKRIKKHARGLAALLLAAAVGWAGAVSPAAAPARGEAAAEFARKDEVVYAALSPGGAVRKAYVVNGFEVTRAGALVDYGGYTAAENLSSTAPLSLAGDAVSTRAAPGSFYYQGTLPARQAAEALPWNFTVRYFLDGRELEPGALAGASGRLEIHIGVAQNPGANPVFYDNYMLQVSVGLDTARCGAIASAGAAIASAGTKKLVTHTVMPGKGAGLVVSAEVQNFGMDGIEISGIPYSVEFELPDTGAMLEGIAQLSGAIDALHGGVGELASGARELSGGAEELAAGSAGFAGGLGNLHAGALRLAEGSAVINSGLAGLSASLSGGAAFAAPEQLARLPAALRQAAEGLSQAAAGLAQLGGGHAAMFAALDAAIMAIPTLPEADIGALAAAVGALDSADPAAAQAQAALARLLSAYAAGQTVLGAYTAPAPAGASIRDGMAALGPALSVASASLEAIRAGLESMAGGIEEALSGLDLSTQSEALAQGVAALAAEYGAFHEGLRAYAEGVAQAAAGYAGLHGGIAALSAGGLELADGAAELYSGTEALSGAAAGIPAAAQSEIDRLTADYAGASFTPVSFASPRNTGEVYVQFVFITEAVKPKPPAAAEEPQAAPVGIWQRFLALFS